MDPITGHVGLLGIVALKALLLFLTAVVGFRIAERRTLSEMSPFDFVAAVAVGAIVGRVPNASDASFLEGAVTLGVVLSAHAAVTRLRRFSLLSAVVDHSPRLIVLNGEVLEREMRRSGLTRADLEGALRQRGLLDLSQVRYAVLEQRGKISVVPETASIGVDADLLTSVMGEKNLRTRRPAG